ncbi:MAG: hypothetical protein R3F56_19455 [Planctomycetota bacterium]
MSPTLANFLFETANFLLLAAALAWLLFAPIRRALDQESASQRQRREAAEHLKEEADAALKAARAAQDAAAQAAEEQRTNALAAARQEATEVVEAARRAADQQRQTMVEEQRQARRVTADAVAEEVGRIAAASVQRLLAELHGPSLDAALVRTACTRLTALPRRAAGPIVVESARPLDGDTRQALATALGATFDLRVVAALGAGVRVTTPAGQVDATAAAVARQAQQALRAVVDASADPSADHALSEASRAPTGGEQA